MKKFIFALACLLTVSSAVYASGIDRAVVDAENKKMTVEGTLGESSNGKLLTLMVLKGNAEENADVNVTTDKIEYADILSVDGTGKYKKEFGFDVSTGYYTAVTVDETGSIEKKTIFYANKDELDQFAYDIGDGKLENDEIIEGIITYKDMLAVDTEYFSDDRNRTILLDEILSEKKTIKTEKSSKLKSVIGSAEEKCKFLDSIENAKTWYDVEYAIVNNTALHEIDLDDYDDVTDKSRVCAPLIGERMKNLDSFVKAFEKLVEENRPSESKESSKSPHRGSGGGGSYSSVSTATTAPDTSSETNTASFTDVPKAHWAGEAIEALSKDGVLSGTGNGAFEPDRTVTRGEAAKIISVAFNITATDGELNFADVPDGSWQYPYVLSLYSAGITNGISENEYGVADGVSREDLAVLLYRVINIYDKKQTVTEKTFKDSGDIADYAREAVSYMAGVGIINGTDTDCFEPKSFATRAQIAKLVYTMAKILK